MTNDPKAKASVPQREIRHAALRVMGLDISEDIAHSSQSPNQGLSSAAIYLATQTAHVNVDHIGFRLDAHAPNAFEDHGARHHPAGISAQEFEQRKLLGGEAEWLAAARDLSLDQVQFKIENAQLGA